MTIFLGFLAGSALVAALFWTLNRRALRRLPTVAQFDLYLDLGPERYRHLSRLFAVEDFRFLESQRSGRALLARLRQERRRIFRLLLADLRRDFEALLAVGSLLSLSATAKDRGYAALLARERFRFFSLYCAWSLLSLWPSPLCGRFDPAPLWQQIETLGRSTRTVMNALTPDDLVRLQRTLGSAEFS